MKRAGAFVVGIMWCAAGCVANGEPTPAGASGPLEAAFSATSVTRLTGSFVETNVVQVARRAHGDAVVVATESTLEFSGGLTGKAQARTTRVTDRTGATTILRSIHLRGAMGRAPVDWHLGAVGDAAGGAFFITHESAPTPAAVGEGTFVAGSRGTVYELPMQELDFDIELSGQNQWAPAHPPLFMSRVAPNVGGEDPAIVLAPVLEARHDHPVPVTIHRTEVEYYLDGEMVEALWEQDVVMPEAGGWNTRVIDDRDENFVSPLPGPWAFVARVFVAGTSQPFVYANLTRVFESRSRGSRFPVDVDGLAAGALYFSFTGHHGHDQRYGHDIWARRWNGSAWSSLRQGTDGSSPEHHLIWDQPVSVMEAGEVVECLDDQLDNPDTSEPDPVFEGSTNHIAGNHYIIRRPPGIVDLYAHMRAGSVDCSALGVGDSVARGDYLGRVGNTGTGAPHLHIHAELSNAPIPYYFTGPQAIEDETFSPPYSPAPWSPLQGRAIPSLPGYSLLR
jgi:hypothetical protein